MSRQPGERTLQHSRSSTAQEKSPRKRLAPPGRGAAGGAGGTISSKGGDADRSRKRARQTAVPRRKAPPARAGGAVIGGGTLLEEQRAASTRRRGGGSGYLRPTSRCTASQNSCLTASPLSVPLSKSADISAQHLFGFQSMHFQANSGDLRKAAQATTSTASLRSSDQWSARIDRAAC